MKKYENQRFGLERALYSEDNFELFNCRFEGEEDGESALKEATNFNVKDCYFDLRYPFWHNDHVKIVNIEMTPNCRAALWYSNNISIKASKMNGIKALRECNDVLIKYTQINSPEFGWKCNNVKIIESKLVGEYAFFGSKNLDINNLDFKGKYSFQYVENLYIKDSKLNTKDAFWHANNVTVEDSILEGEYLAWYSNNLTLIRCHIKGTQPLCYCNNLKLIDCTMENTDLAFENSDVEATIIGHVDSIKNPRSGTIKVDSLGEHILESTKHKVEGKVIIK